MISRTTTKFWKSYKRFPKEIKEKSKEVFNFFQKDPFHPNLHFKRVHSSKPIFSIRITKDYRAIGILEKAGDNRSFPKKRNLLSFNLLIENLYKGGVCHLEKQSHSLRLSVLLLPILSL